MDHPVSLSPSFLQAQIGTNVRLTFVDGEVVVARLLAVDPDREGDLTYEVIRIVNSGSPRPAGTETGRTYIAPLGKLREWQPED